MELTVNPVSVRRIKSYSTMDMNVNPVSIRRISSMPKGIKDLINVGIHGHTDKNKINFGICFDIDGVLARGATALPQTPKAFELLKDEHGKFKVPVCFVTNALNKDEDKAEQISDWIGMRVSPTQMVQSPGPLKVFTKYHDKRCLFVGQGKIREIAQDLGFTNVCTMDEIVEAYPLLDVVDHDNRKRNAAGNYTEKDFPRVEAIVLLGEPIKWDQSLQLLVDLLVTDGKPDKAPGSYPEEHLPVIACNMDLLFMEMACMPRYGHGAFLLCLESLYCKVTGKELKYSSLVGKPSEITFRYAEHCLSREAKNLGIMEPITTMYLIGDTPSSDILGANLYQQYVDHVHENMEKIIEGATQNKKEMTFDPSIPASRNIPSDAGLFEQTVEECDGILVCTGVYKTENDEMLQVKDEKHNHSHRDIPVTSELYKPFRIKEDVYEAVKYILERENLL